MGITLKQPLPEDESRQPEDGSAPHAPDATVPKVLCTRLSLELQSVHAVAVTGVSQCCFPPGRDVQMVILILQMQTCSTARLCQCRQALPWRGRGTRLPHRSHVPTHSRYLRLLLNVSSVDLSSR